MVSMNPSNNETNGLQLPPPVMEQLPPSPGMTPEVGVPMAEHPPATPETTALAPPQATPQLQQFQPAVSQTQPAVQATTQVSTLPLADDDDLIEKEWVERAKRIVEQTRDDPYKQSEELTVVKADYLQQRYNKSIKLNG